MRKAQRARQLNPGETMLDFGSGESFNVLRMARRVGLPGKAYGRHMTNEMLVLARENQQKAGLRRSFSRGNQTYSAARQLGLCDYPQMPHESVATKITWLREHSES